MGERGIDAAPEDILLTNGSQQGLDLLAKLFLDPGDLVVVENPSYLGAIQVFRSYQACFETVPTDGEVRKKEIELIRTGKLYSIASLSIPKMFSNNNLRLYDEQIQNILELIDTHDPEGVIAVINGLIARRDKSEASLSIPKMFSNNNLRLYDEQIQNILELIDTHDPEGVIAVINGLIARRDKSELLKNTSKPFVFILGNEDNYITSEMILRIESDFPGKSIIIEKCGHACFIENKDATANAVKSFLEKYITRENC
jgi:pimeloyl-ACP methyl ester carboxylesterase